ncbi:glycosyl transferase family 6 [Mucilaginibacter mali]|uniref:Glycosyl transferase family 6 n=1 Tax=Mucilaginibacter mali TaxID=2740462 RepID=A0A7D4QFK9_9SPHI|nr:family 6 glucosyltransferase [Mucilaginibacter mali]QKJ30432.1 glycosyl transferase family 6 [Mucilaginibacter mali]
MIGILYICTGKYDIFWKKFYTSAEKYFLPGHKKIYFVFTDASRIYAEEKPNIKKIYQETLGWPYNTLLRFEMFLKAEEYLQQCGYLFYLNANIVFTDTVSDDILPANGNEGLLVVKHPGYWDKTNDVFPYDRNPDSLASIASGQGQYYFMGGFNGGQTDAYLQLIKTLKNNIRTDLDKGVIALWHDESHLNKYMLDRNPKILSPAYGYAEGFDLPFEPKVLILKKEKYGGHDYLRNISAKKKKRSVMQRFKNLVHILRTGNK